MIAQTMAITEPQRVRSLTSIMSTTGKRSVGWQHPSLLPSLLVPRGPGREAYVATNPPGLEDDRLPRLPAGPRPNRRPRRGDLRPRCRRERGAPPDDGGPDPAQPRRRLRGISVPTLVIHGVADKMVHASGGRATAAAIPGAELLLIDGMGHDLPAPALRPSSRPAAEIAERAEMPQVDRHHPDPTRRWPADAAARGEACSSGSATPPPWHPHTLPPSFTQPNTTIQTPPPPSTPNRDYRWRPPPARQPVTVGDARETTNPRRREALLSPPQTVA